MTARSGQLEAGEVTVTDEHLVAAGRLVTEWYPPTTEELIQRTARAYAERDAAAERRGAERERGGCAALAADFRIPSSVAPTGSAFVRVNGWRNALAAAIRARGK